MAIGFMEVQLVKAKGLCDTDFFGSMDPYVVIQYNGQERRSSVAKGQGNNPVWNEKFEFKVEYPTPSNSYKVILKIMDKDSLSADDFVGQAIVYVEDLLAIGVGDGAAELQPLKYRVIREDQSYCGEIDVGITFKVEEEFNGETKRGRKDSN
ncbi:hypothetical protein AAZX31_18G037900 [Glycine max]|uniref:C2 domain-containing protein n=2 Tax=Glycine subgen. Soja TaxID=1462606 RepID=C6TG79_SOYBN|nr:16 kDa phloem protein 1-like [Glycine max]XP_028211979.1 elicitor-responsive protein 1-like [Glycine soja]ACU20831.1 unknown [Glycine max]KAG4920338.1 hypothetical protein JHK86_049151 [Glycine max]KAG4934989.1 hypothetical protein JHK85_049908 [Glycine max]KAG5090517.1 hypothetical protein JHK82_049295 [Glycine max]KAG5093600.1 hypothetical protein JHK84_049188 [Glycine max]|eukprot:NP_001241108.1 uncharacterized protein LOC100805025 [Glycine max]